MSFEPPPNSVRAVTKDHDESSLADSLNSVSGPLETLAHRLVSAKGNTTKKKQGLRRQCVQWN